MFQDVMAAKFKCQDAFKKKRPAKEATEKKEKVVIPPREKLQRNAKAKVQLEILYNTPQDNV